MSLTAVDDTPIELEVGTLGPLSVKGQALKLFTSYSFDQSILTPASPFRFTAQGLTQETRALVRSGAAVKLYVNTGGPIKTQIATGFIDETDTHLTATTLEYVLTGRDTIGQLIDNSAIDSSNKLIHLENATLAQVAQLLIAGTRIPGFTLQNAPGGTILFQTNPGETKITALQRYLEYTNCLVWSKPDGTMVVGKPNMSVFTGLPPKLLLHRKNPERNNVLEARVRRNVNTAIRQIAVQLQSLDQVDPTSATIKNTDKDVSAVATYKIGKSIYRTFSLGNGADLVNKFVLIGSNGTPQDIGTALSRREIAMSNIQVLDVELVVNNHVDANGAPYQIDKIYNVHVEDDDVEENMYCYSCRYELTKEKGRTTTMRLCRRGAIVADVPVR